MQQNLAKKQHAHLVYSSINFHWNDKISIVHWLLKEKTKTCTQNKTELNLKHNFIMLYTYTHTSPPPKIVVPEQIVKMY